jgi:hypothetical protein
VRPVKVGTGATLVITEQAFAAAIAAGSLKIGCGSTVIVAPSDEAGFLAKVREAAGLKAKA